jgi:hypothetical protein
MPHDPSGPTRAGLAREVLLHSMKDYSEDFHCAGWVIGLVRNPGEQRQGSDSVSSKVRARMPEPRRDRRGVVGLRGRDPARRTGAGFHSHGTLARHPRRTFFGSAKMKSLLFKIEHGDWSAELQVPHNFTLAFLARSIIEAVGFDFDHCYGFCDNLRNPYLARPVTTTGKCAPGRAATRTSLSGPEI